MPLFKGGDQISGQPPIETWKENCLLPETASHSLAEIVGYEVDVDTFTERVKTLVTYQYSNNSRSPWLSYAEDAKLFWGEMCQELLESSRWSDLNVMPIMRKLLAEAIKSGDEGTVRVVLAYGTEELTRLLSQEGVEISGDGDV